MGLIMVMCRCWQRVKKIERNCKSVWKQQHAKWILNQPYHAMQYTYVYCTIHASVRPLFLYLSFILIIIVFYVYFLSAVCICPFRAFKECSSGILYHLKIKSLPHLSVRTAFISPFLLVLVSISRTKWAMVLSFIQIDFYALYKLCERCKVK